MPVPVPVPLLLLLLLMAASSNVHAQRSPLGAREEMAARCLNGLPPFRPEGVMRFCGDFSDASCCTSAEDAAIKRNHTLAYTALDAETARNCGTELKQLMCARCFPYAARLFRSRSLSETPKELPGFCRDSCRSFHSRCSKLVDVLDVSQATKQSANWPDYFCNSWQQPEMRHGGEGGNEDDADGSRFCFPRALADRSLISAASSRIAEPERCFCMQTIKEGLKNPVAIKDAPGSTDGYLYAAEQVGIIRVFDPNTGRSIGVNDGKFLDIPQLIEVTGDGFGAEDGLQGFAFDPEYASNRKFYVLYKSKEGSRLRLSEFTTTREDLYRATRRHVFCSISIRRLLLTMAAT